MALRDLITPEVRIRCGAEFQQIPNFVVASEELGDGMFLVYNGDGEYEVAAANSRATHFVKRSGEKRNSITEIANDIGITLEGEPVMAFQGSGIVRLPCDGSVEAGDRMVVGSNGYAEVYTSGAAYLVGVAVETVDADPYGTAWADIQVDLPAQYVAA